MISAARRAGLLRETGTGMGGLGLGLAKPWPPWPLASLCFRFRVVELRAARWAGIKSNKPGLIRPSRFRPLSPYHVLLR